MSANEDFFERFEDFIWDRPHPKWTLEGAESFVTDWLSLLALDQIPEPVMTAMGKKLQERDTVVSIDPRGILELASMPSR